MSCASASQAIGEGLQANTGLVTLVLNDNEIGDQGGEAWWNHVEAIYMPLLVGVAPIPPPQFGVFPHICHLALHVMRAHGSVMFA